MKYANSPYLSALNEITWQNIGDFSFPSHNVRDWLLEQGSLSKRLRDNCGELTVELYQHQWCPGDQLARDENNLLSSPPYYLLRRVVLSGDGQPWVIGSTIIPQSTAEDRDYNLSKLGETPLGEEVFKAETVDRDSLQLSHIVIEGGFLYARRSRLWMNHKPMLVTELFLPSAPIYHQEKP
jgi:chorismate--pyruvate lyase